MVQIHEIRYKNYFETVKHGNIIQISGFRTYSTDKPLLRYENHGGEYGLDQIKPIELNDKTMLKIKGFEQVYNSKYTKIIEMYNPDKMQLIRWTFKKDKKEYTVEINGHFYPHIQFLHQFQNLFFSLFGEELVFSTEP